MLKARVCLRLSLGAHPKRVCGFISNFGVISRFAHAAMLADWTSRIALVFEVNISRDRVVIVKPQPD